MTKLLRLNEESVISTSYIQSMEVLTTTDIPQTKWQVVIVLPNQNVVRLKAPTKERAVEMMNTIWEVIKGGRKLTLDEEKKGIFTSDEKEYKGQHEVKPGCDCLKCTFLRRFIDNLFKEEKKENVEEKEEESSNNNNEENDKKINACECNECAMVRAFLSMGVKVERFNLSSLRGDKEGGEEERKEEVDDCIETLECKDDEE